MKTFILAIFGLLALVNAQRPVYRRPPHVRNLEEEDVYGEPYRVAPVAKTNDDNDGPKPYIAYEYVQLFSWSLVASILNCFYKISV